MTRTLLQVKLQVDVMLCVLTATEAGRYRGQPQALRRPHNVMQVNVPQNTM